MNKQLTDKEVLNYKIDQLTNQISITAQKYEKLNFALRRKNHHFFILVFLIITIMLFFIFPSILHSNNVFLEGGHFITQSLRGDSVITWLAWNLPEPESILHVHISNHAQVSKRNLAMIEESIMSEKIIVINDLETHKGSSMNSSKFYTGWQGILNDVDRTGFQYNLPNTLHTHESMDNDGDILILLINEKNSEGYSGYTRSIIDDEQNQILKSRITIYDAGQLDGHRLADITRHEMGHALGLQHSSDPDDIMYYKINTNNQYISECDLGALESLYRGDLNSQHICKK
ncbi:MAG: matrixin family metalloprotease [Candidatus Nitrosopumilus sp. bin_68KS]